MANDYIEILLTGIPEEHKDTNIVLCLYTTDGGVIKYIDNGVTSDSIVGVSFNGVTGE